MFSTKKRFTKAERKQGKKNLLQLARWINENKVRGWNMMRSSFCAMAQIRKAFPDRDPMTLPDGYDYYDSYSGRPGAHTFFAFTRSEENRLLKENLFANDNTQKEQVAMMRKFARTNPGYKVT